MNLFALSGLLTGITSLGVGFFVLLKAPAQKLSRAWFAFTLSVSVWGFGVLWIATESDPDRALLAWRLAYAFGVIWIPVLFYHFALIFCEKEGNLSLPFHYIVSGIFSLLCSFTSLIHANVRYVFSSFYYAQPGPLFLVYFVWWTGLVGYAHYTVYKSYHMASDLKRNQFKYILIAFVLAYGTGSLAYLPQFGIDVYPAYGTFGIMSYPLIVTYAIGAYHVMDIETAVHKTFAWITTSLLFLIPVLFLTWLAEPWLRQQRYGYLAGFIGALIVMMVYMRTLQPAIDQLFQRRQHQDMAVLRTLLQDHVVLRSLSDVATNIAKTLTETLYVSKVRLWVWDDPTQRFRSMASDHPPAAEPVSDGKNRDPAMVWMRRNRQIVCLDEVGRDPQYARMREVVQGCFRAFDADMMVPFIQEGRIVGVLTMGQKTNGKPFQYRDITFLSTLQGEMTIAISNAISYDQAQRLSHDLRAAAATLEQKVLDRTRDLQESKQLVEAAYEKLNLYQQAQETFFADINHEIRTPLALIISSLEMLPHPEEALWTPEQGQQMENMRTQSNRLLKLVNNLLYIAKLDTGNVELYYRQDDFVRWAEGIVAGFLPIATQKALSLVFEGTDALPEAVFFDAEQMERVLSNLVMNALKFTPTGGVTVLCQREDDAIRVSVSDTGVGIPEEKLENLFGRFSSIGSTTERRYQGTGIGLSMVSQIVAYHGGTLGVRSEVGKGTTFEFTLPIRTHVHNAIVKIDLRHASKTGVQPLRRVEGERRRLPAEPQRGIF